LAVADANAKFGVKVAYTWKEIGCDATQATAAISRMLQDDIVDAVIGPDCEASCESSAYLTAGLDILQISYSCCSDLLSNKKKYPTVEPLPAPHPYWCEPAARKGGRVPSG
jgi:ABC-type branched-subunit amino acid transport system substrate-binding protein